MADTQPTTSPQAVASFAQQAKSMGYTPEHFSQLYPHVAATRMRLLGLNTDVSDMAPHVGQTPDQVLAAVRGQPHPVYPEHTAGGLFDVMQAAGLFARSHIGRDPVLAEGARMLSAGMKHADIQGYYRGLANPDVPSMKLGPSGPGLAVIQGGNDRVKNDGKSDSGNADEGDTRKRKEGGAK